MSLSKFLMGAAVGLAAGCAIAHLYQKGYFDGACDQMNDLTLKTKKKMKDMVDLGENQLEYAKERIQYKAGQAEEKLKHFRGQAEE